MKLSQISISRPVSITMFFVGVALLGLFAFGKLGVDLLPNVNLPYLLITTDYENTSPELIEKLLTEPIESTVTTVNGVKDIQSVSTEGKSIVSVSFVWGTDMDIALLHMREKLDNVSFLLPRDAGRPTIVKSDPSASPIMRIVVSYNNLSSQLRIPFVDKNSSKEEIDGLVNLKELARLVFKRRLEQLDGISQAVVTGGLEREILVELDEQEVNTYGISLSEINNAISSSNVNLPAGSIMKGLFRYSLRSIGEYQSPEEIGKTIIRRNENGSTILLEDIAEISENFKERDGLTRLNGNETVGLLVYKEPESNTVTASTAVKEVITSLEDDYPEYKLLVISDQSKFIENAIINVQQEIFFGGVLAVLVLFFFLGSIRNIFIIGITIPSSLVLTVLLMYLFEVNFNIVSLGGIAVGVGMLLDNAIVVIENIVRHKEKGLSFKAASLIGSSEVSMPIVAATLTTIAVFMPLLFIKGVAGELFRDQSYAIAFSLSASILTAITLIPMLASREKFSIIKNKSFYNRDSIVINTPVLKTKWNIFKYWLKLPFSLTMNTIRFVLGISIIKAGELFRGFFDKFYKKANRSIDNVINKYEILLEWSLKNRGKVIIFTLVLVIATIIAAVDIKKEFIPDSPQDEFIVEFDFLKGTSIEGNVELTTLIENSVKKIPGIKNIVSNIGVVNHYDYFNNDQVSINNTSMILKLESVNDYYTVQDKLRKIFKNLGEIEYAFKKIKTTYTEIIQPSEVDIVVNIIDKDINEAYRSGEKLVKLIKEENIRGISDFRMGVDLGVQEFIIQVDHVKCSFYGLSINDVTNQIVNFNKGNNSTTITDFDKKIPIKVIMPEENRNEIEDLLKSYVNKDNISVPVRELVTVSRSENFNEIRRVDQSRVVPLFAEVDNISIDEAIEKVQSIINKLPEKSEQRINISGTNVEINESFSAIYIALLVSVLFMYMILAMEFESFIFPFIILFSVPLGLIGGILLLYILGESISIISLMGMIILVGIADNDAVVKVEFIMRKRKEGYSLNDSVIQAGKDRFRPIVMNSFTVIFALIPMMIGFGAGTQLRVSLSIAIAGGLLSATFLTLIIIPVLYTYMEKLSRKDLSKIELDN